MLHGPSGVGKSSLLHAGVVHRLRSKAGAAGAGVLIIDDWSGDPCARLAAEVQALADAAATAPDDAPVVAGATYDVAPELDENARAVVEAVQAYRANRRGGLLLILDQFEEFLRLFPDPSKTSFDEALSALVGDTNLGVRVLVAIREDRLADLDRFADDIPQLLGNVLRLGPLSPKAALEAITGPIEDYAGWAGAAAGGREVALQQGLAERVRDERVALSSGRPGDPEGAATHNGAGGEPHVETTFLQLVMRRLWDEDVAAPGDNTTIHIATLDRLGSVKGIVDTHVDTALEGLSDDEQSLTAEMLRYLVTPSGATACLTAQDLSVYTKSPRPRVEALAETLSKPPRRILRGVAAAPGGGGAGGYELPQVLANPALDWRMRYNAALEAARLEALSRIAAARLEARARRLLLALVAMTAVAIGLVGYALELAPLHRLDHATIDARFELRGARAADSRIALVTIDAATERELRKRPPGRFRGSVARALDVIAAARPRAVALDIGYSTARDRTGDEALFAAITGPLAERLVLTTRRLDVDEDGRLPLLGRPELYSDHSTPAVAYTGFPRDPVDTVRRVRREIAAEPGAKAIQTLEAVTARLAGAADPKRLPGIAWIDYRGPQGTFPRIAFDDVLDRRAPALAKLRGKVVVLGLDQIAVRTSAPGQSMMLGPEIHANSIATALDGFPLRDAGSVVDLALVVLLGLLPLGLALRLRPLLIVPVAIAAAVLFCVAAHLAFGAGRVISVVYPLGTLALATIGVTAVLALRARRAARSGGAPALPAPVQASEGAGLAAAG